MSRSTRLSTALLALVSLCGVPPANAADVASAHVSFVLVTSMSIGQRGFFALDKPITGTPACNTQQRYVVDPATASGAAQLAILQQAFATRALVTVHGAGNCNFHGDSESADWVMISTQ